jgi:hypothetical protein
MGLDLSTILSSGSDFLLVNRLQRTRTRVTARDMIHLVCYHYFIAVLHNHNQCYLSIQSPAHSRRRTTDHQPNISVNNFRPSTSQDRTRSGTEYSGAPIYPLPQHAMGHMGEERTLEYMCTLMILALVPLARFWVRILI